MSARAAALDNACLAFVTTYVELEKRRPTHREIQIALALPDERCAERRLMRLYRAGVMRRTCSGVGIEILTHTISQAVARQ